MLSISSRVSVWNEDEMFKYTIDTFEDGPVDIFYVTKVTGAEIRNALDIVERHRGIVNRIKGVIFFKAEKDADKFKRYLKDTMDNRMRSLLKIKGLKEYMRD